MNWEKIKRIAFLGTDRAGIEEISTEEFASLKHSKEGDPAEVLIKTVVLTLTKNRAGKSTHLLAAAAPPLKSSSQNYSLSSRAALYLESILDDTYADALPEFLDLCIQTQQKIPTHVVPDLINVVEDGLLNWDHLQKTLSDNALALIQQHPKWKSFSLDTTPDQWEATDQKQRMAYLHFLRKINPSEAIVRLTETWPQETLKQKVQFLDLLDTGLNHKDEIFLKKCLEEEEILVRQKAAELLLLLPNSALSLQLYDYIFQWVEEGQEGELTIYLPEQEASFWKNLGLQKKDQGHSFGSRSASCLGQLISKLHPSYWNTFLNLPPDECLPLMEASNLANLLIPSVVTASISHHEQEWIDAMAMRLFSGKSSLGVAYTAVLEKISAPTFNHLLIRQLKNQSFLMEEQDLAFSSLQLSDHPWSDELALAILTPFQQWLASARSAQWQTWHYKKVLQMAAYRINPNLVSRLAQGWQFQSYIGFQWQEDIEKLNKTLNFRKGMRKAILENSKKNPQ